MESTMIINVVLAVMNFGFMIMNYKLKNYKSAMFSGIAFGWITSFIFLG